MGMPGGTELLIIFGIVVLLFGAKKIPELAKGMGKGIKNFKNEMKNDELDEPKKVEPIAEKESDKSVKDGESKS